MNCKVDRNRSALQGKTADVRLLQGFFKSETLSLHFPYAKLWALRIIDIQRFAKPLHNTFGRDVRRQRDNSNNPRRAIDSVEYPSGLDERVPLCELDLLRVVSPVQLRLRRTCIYT
jgi:hypothetical protein